MRGNREGIGVTLPSFPSFLSSSYLSLSFPFFSFPPFIVFLLPSTFSFPTPLLLTFPFLLYQSLPSTLIYNSLPLFYFSFPYPFLLSFERRRADIDDAGFSEGSLSPIILYIEFQGGDRRCNDLKYSPLKREIRTKMDEIFRRLFLGIVVEEMEFVFFDVF